MNRLPEKPRDEKLQRRRDKGGNNGDAHLPRVAQRHARNADQRAHAAPPLRIGHMRKGIAAPVRACSIIGAQGSIQTVLKIHARKVSK